MMSRNLPAGSLVGRVVHQRFGVALDGGERRPQLVRHIRDEVAPDLIGAAQVRDVVQHEHRPSSCRDDRRDPRNQRPRHITRDRELEPFGGVASQRPGQLIGDARMPNGFEIRMVDGVVMNVQHPPRRVVHVLQTP
jgi:hypothetical protein